MRKRLGFLANSDKFAEFINFNIHNIYFVKDISTAYIKSIKGFYQLKALNQQMTKFELILRNFDAVRF